MQHVLMLQGFVVAELERLLVTYVHPQDLEEAVVNVLFLSVKDHSW